MTSSAWLRSRRRAEAVLAAYAASAETPELATGGLVTPDGPLVIEPGPAPYVMPANAAAHLRLRTELDRRSLRDSLERCGCWPRYIGTCHCISGSAQ